MLGLWECYCSICDTKAQFNENLEREYSDLNEVERFVVDNSKVFEIEVPLKFCFSKCR
jgi:hypothetical protein